jgi:ornithine cyclodeaminase
VAAIGAGPQAIGHVRTLREALAGDRPIGRVRFLVRDPARAAAALPPDDVVVPLGGTAAADALRAADVVVCATSAREPLFDSALIGAEAVVIAVGSHEPDAREVDAALCRRASVVVEDVGTALREAGDIVLAVAEGAIEPADLVPLADVATGRFQPPPGRPVLFKSVGMSWEDLVVARAVAEGAALP